MSKEKKYAAIRDRIARRRRTFIPVKERNEIIYSLTTGMKEPILDHKRKENASAIRATTIEVNA